MDSFLNSINVWLGIPPEAAEHAPQIDAMLGFVHWFMLILFVGWTAFFIAMLIRFRRSKNPKADHDGFKGKTPKVAELVVVIVEAVLLFGFAFPLWSKRVNDFPTKAESADQEAIQVRVVAEQYAWSFHYPGRDGQFGRRDLKLVSSDNPTGLDRSDPVAVDDIVTMNQIHLPVDRPAILHITSKDVIHSLAQRNMRICQDAIPGMSVPLWFIPTVTTAEMRKRMANEKYEYEIACSQLCGLGHYRMRAFMTIESQQEYDAWLDAQAQELSAAASAEPAANEYE